MIDSRPIAVPDNYEPTDSRALDMPHVVAQWVQNIGGGIGAGMALAAALWLLGADLAAAWRWPVGIAAIVAGASTMVRAYLDEYRSERRWNKREREHAAEMTVLVELCDRLEAERDDARNQYNTLRADYDRMSNELEATRYRNVAANTSSRHVPIQDTYSNAARADARELIRQWYATAAWPGERTMQWTRSRHSTARDLLSRAGLLPNGTPTNAAPPPESEAWAVAKLAAYLGNTASTASSPRRGLEVGDAVDAPNAAGE
jgi:hypothetical protein